MKYRYWLAGIYELSNSKKCQLINEGISAEELFFCSKEKLEKIDFLTLKDIDKLLNSKRKTNIDKEWSDFLTKGINLTTVEDSKYPEKLKNIYDCPYGLFYIGNLPTNNERTVAIVGARNRSAYGSDVARAISKKLAENNISVISGMARGIDSDSHIGALDSGGRTYAVLGSGVDVCYPAQNKYIYDRISSNGGILSENSPGTKAMPHLFPLRNRIISGLCDALIVIEAKEKSGSLISADYALEQGKDIYALPGRINDTLSEGCNRLIAQGANIICGIDDLVKSLDISTADEHIQMDFKKNLLEKDEVLVYSLLDFRPLGISFLMNESNMELCLLLNVLERLQEKGFIREIIPNYFVKCL